MPTDQRTPTPADWFFAQHGPSFVGTNTSGKFSIVLFDNGDDRGVADVAGGTCGTGQPVALADSTVPLLGLDETAMTATLAIPSHVAGYIRSSAATPRSSRMAMSNTTWPPTAHW